MNERRRKGRQPKNGVKSRYKHTKFFHEIVTSATTTAMAVMSKSSLGLGVGGSI